MEYGFHRRIQNIMKFQSGKGKKKKRKQEKKSPLPGLAPKEGLILRLF